MVAIKHELDTVQQVKEEIEELREYVDRLEEHTHRRKLRLMEQVSETYPVTYSAHFMTLFVRQSCSPSCSVHFPSLAIKKHPFGLTPPPNDFYLFLYCPTSTRVLYYLLKHSEFHLHQGLTFFLTYAIFAAVLGMLQFGYNTGVINAPEVNIENFMKDVYKDRYGEDISEEFIQQLYSVAVSIFAIGGMLGGFSGGWMANRFGR